MLFSSLPLCRNIPTAKITIKSIINFTQFNNNVHAVTIYILRTLCHQFKSGCCVYLVNKITDKLRNQYTVYIHETIHECT